MSLSSPRSIVIGFKNTGALLRQGVLRGMAKSSKIDLIIHCDGGNAMFHSARTDYNVAIAPSTAVADIALLLNARSRIESSISANADLKPADLEKIGSDLADVLFAGNVRQLYDAAANGNSVELSICANDMLLKSIPWEFIRWPDVQMAPHPRRSICRLVAGTQARPPSLLKLTDGVRVMLVVSQPVDQDPVEWIETHKRMDALFSVNLPKSDAKAVSLEIAEAGGADALSRQINRFDPHIVHFIGHGTKGGIWLTRHQSNKGRLLPSEMVFSVLSSKSTRLVILSACDTANVGDDIAPLVSTAERMVQAGLPAVVANQMPISLRSISAFCGALYGELLASGNVDWAVTAGRTALGVEYAGLDSAAVEWGVPVLYRRPGCSQLFGVGK